VLPVQDQDNENPHVQLWEGLTFVVLEASFLRSTCWEATTPIKLLDQAPRHDTHLVDEKWCGTVNGIISGDESVLGKAERQLRLSIEAIELARRAICGQFRGEEKVKTEEALTRHLTEAQRLLATFEELEVAPRTPYQPYQVRQKCLNRILLQIGVLLDLITPLRRKFNAEQFPDGLLTQLIEQEAALFRLRAKVSKWRDNPSQKLEAKFEVCLEQTTAISESLSQLRAAARAECRRQGIKFYNRFGAVS
jgi:hypothetical protein